MSATSRQLARALEAWFERAQRDLSWRRTRDPYAIWVSEIMLQQTRVQTVEAYYGDFLRRFPTVDLLAAADEDDVLRAWSGLGYYRRARLLHRGARYVAGELGGELPREVKALRRVPGVGPYTAGAIAAIAFDQPEPLVDGNVARVLSRIYAVSEPAQQQAKASHHWEKTRAILAEGTPRVLAQSLMELGATVCTPRAPNCLACPVRDLCRAQADDLTDQIPAPRRRTPSPTEHLWALALCWGGRTLLYRRPAEGLLAGMWCLPLMLRGVRASRPDLARLAALTGAEIELDAAACPPLKHVFTHRIWQLTPWRVRLLEPPRAKIDGHAWATATKLPAGGIPSVTTKLLRAVKA
ncbi:MAG: A/G-specific adenine glycosylase [Nannocystaceae bacterium]